MPGMLDPVTGDFTNVWITDPDAEQSFGDPHSIVQSHVNSGSSYSTANDVWASPSLGLIATVGAALRAKVPCPEIAAMVQDKMESSLVRGSATMDPDNIGSVVAARFLPVLTGSILRIMLSQPGKLPIISFALTRDRGVPKFLPPFLMGSRRIAEIPNRPGVRVNPGNYAWEEVIPLRNGDWMVVKRKMPTGLVASAQGIENLKSLVGSQGQGTNPIVAISQTNGILPGGLAGIFINPVVHKVYGDTVLPQLPGSIHQGRHRMR